MELPKLNASPVVFIQENHTYMLDGKLLSGVTGTLVRRACPNTYSIPEGMTEEQWREKLRNAAVHGTFVHQTIELYEDIGAMSDLPELKNYIAVKDDNGFVNLATEYIVSDEEHYASAIDHVWYQPETKTIVLVDIKRTSEIHEEDVTWQTSIYKKFFLRQNPHLKDYTICIALLWLRKEKFEFRVLHPFADEVIDALIDADLKNEVFDIRHNYGNFPVRFAEVEDMIAMLDAEMKEKKEKYERLTKGLFDLMVKHGIQKFTGSKVQLTITKPTKRESFDKEAFKFDHPELYDRYKCFTDVKSSLRITVKK